MTSRLLLMAFLLGISGCGGEDRKPPPEIVIQVLEQPGVYLFDGKRVFSADLREEMQRVADRYRRPTTNTSRVIIRLHHASTVNYQRVQQVLGWCAELGLDKITIHSRQGDSAVPDPDGSLSPRALSPGH